MPKFSYFWALSKMTKNLGDILARGPSNNQAHFHAKLKLLFIYFLIVWFQRITIPPPWRNSGGVGWGSKTQEIPEGRGVCMVDLVSRCPLIQYGSRYHSSCWKILSYQCTLRAGSLVVLSSFAGEENGARKSEPARELLIFEFRPWWGVKLAFHKCQITIQ